MSDSTLSSSTPILIEENPFQCTMIEDSISIYDIRLSTMHVRYPRIVHSELMTHRVFSRNARSSRAVPTKKLLEEPIYLPRFEKNAPGMQASGELLDEYQGEAEKIWIESAKGIRDSVAQLHELGVHKQWANRPLEWFGFIDVLISSTYWENWFALRDHEYAQPEMQTLAKLMRETLDNSTPVRRHSDYSVDGWHLPYITDEERVTHNLPDLRMMSTARCARISYKPFEHEEGVSTIEKDLALYNKLMVTPPLHASPAEHVACSDTPIASDLGNGQSITYWLYQQEHGNFTGWRQFRKQHHLEAIMEKLTAGYDN